MWILILVLFVIILLVIIIEHQNAKKIRKLKEKYLYNPKDWETRFRRNLPINIPEDHGVFKFVPTFLQNSDVSFSIASYKDGQVYGYFPHSENELQIIGYYKYNEKNTDSKVCSIFNKDNIEIGYVENDGYIYLSRIGHYNHFRERAKVWRDTAGTSDLTEVDSTIILNKDPRCTSENIRVRKSDVYKSTSKSIRVRKSALPIYTHSCNSTISPPPFPSPLEKELGRVFATYISDGETHENIGEFDGEKFGAAAACVCLSVECHMYSKYSNFVSKW